MISDEQLEEFQDSLCNWLRENPPDAKLVLDRKPLSELVLELKSHKCLSTPYFERLLAGTSPSTLPRTWSVSSSSTPTVSSTLRP